MEIIIRDVEEVDGRYKVKYKDGAGGFFYVDKQTAEAVSIPIEPPVKPEICVHISKIDSGGSFIDSERLSKRFTEYNLIPQLETKINLISEDGQYLEQFEVIQIYYEVDKKLKIDIYLDEY